MANSGTTPPGGYYTTPYKHYTYYHYSTPPSNVTSYYEHVADNEPDLPGWEQIDLSLLLYWPAAMLNITLLTVLIASPTLRCRPNLPLVITTCIINLANVIHIYVSHFHRYSVPVYLKMKGLCELMTVLSAVIRVFTPYIFILVGAERLYTLETRRVMTLPAMRMRHSFMLLATLFVATLIITLTGILGISGGFYYDYTINGDYVCFVVFNRAGYYFYTTMLFLIPGSGMLILQIFLVRTYIRYKYGTIQTVPVRMRDTESLEDTPRDNGYSNEAGSPDPTPQDTDDTTQIDEVTEEPPEEEERHPDLRQEALVAWVSLLVFFIPWILQLIIHYISWYSSHYVGRDGEHVLNIFMLLYPLSWLILDLEIRGAYRGVCCLCLPRRAARDDEVRLV